MPTQRTSDMPSRPKIWSWWLIISQWIVAACFTWSSLILLLVNFLTMHHYQHALGGMPLPAITQWTAASAVWFYLYPVPIVLIAAYGSFPSARKDFLIFAHLAAFAFSVAMILTIILGTVLPAIPYWPVSMSNQ
jgi:hypothetical protein